MTLNRFDRGEPDGAIFNDDCIVSRPTNTWADVNCFSSTNVVCELAAERCGDGIRQAGEACDDGNRVDADSCTSTCTVR